MTTGKRLMRGSVLNLADQVLRFLAVFVMTPIIVLSLGEERYGFWALLMSVLGHYSLLDFGLSFSVSRFFSRAMGRDDRGELGRLITTAFSIFLRIGGLGLAITVVGYLVAPYLIDDPEHLGLARFVVLVYGCYVSAGFPVRVFRSLLKSQLRYDLLVLGSAVQIVVANVLIYFYLQAGYGLAALAVINVAAGLLEYGIVSVAGMRAMRGLAVRRSAVDREMKGDLIRYSLTSFLTSFGHQLRSQVDPIILGTFVGFSAVTFYSVGMRFPIYLTDVIGAVLGGQMLAVFSQLHGSGDEGKLRERFLMATRASTVAAVFCGSAMIYYGEAFLDRWMGEGFGDGVPYQVMAILTVPFVFALMQYPSLSFIYALAKHRSIMWTMLCGGAFNLGLSFILVHRFGVLGVVWATFVEMVLVYVVVFPLIVIRAGGIPAGRFYWEALGLPMVKTLGILVPYYLLVRPYVTADYVRLGGFGIGQVVYFVPLAFFLILGSEERRMIMGSLGKGNGGPKGGRR